MLAGMHSRTLPLLLALALAAAPTLARDDHARARAWVEAGRVLPLAELLERLPPELDGRVLEAELEERDGRPVYELELLAPDGRVLELELDAADGTLLRQKVERD